MVTSRKVAMYHQPVQAKANKPVANPAAKIQPNFHFFSFASSASRKSQVISTGKNTAYTSVSELSPVVRETKNAETAKKKAVKKPPTLFLVSFFPMKKPGMTVSAEKMVPTKKKVYINGKSPKKFRKRCHTAPNQLWKFHSPSLRGGQDDNRPRLCRLLYYFPDSHSPLHIGPGDSNNKGQCLANRESLGRL